MPQTRVVSVLLAPTLSAHEHVSSYQNAPGARRFGSRGRSGEGRPLVQRCSGTLVELLGRCPLNGARRQQARGRSLCVETVRLSAPHELQLQRRGQGTSGVCHEHVQVLGIWKGHTRTRRRAHAEAAPCQVDIAHLPQRPCAS